MNLAGRRDQRRAGCARRRPSGLAENATERRAADRRRPPRRPWRPGLQRANDRGRRRVCRRLEHFVPLAPLHQPNNLAPIRAIRARRRRSCRRSPASTRPFTGATPEVADRYAIPEELYREGVRRYGFHGLSYEYIAKSLPTACARTLPVGRVCRASRQWRLHVRASGRPERREHDGLHRA